MIEQIIIAVLAIHGIHAVTRDGELLGFVERALSPYRWANPITECPLCMSGLWGTASFFAFNHSGGLPMILWPVFVFAVAGVNHLISEILWAD